MKMLPLLFLIALATASRADVVATSTVSQVVVFTNAQANFAWSPSALILTFPAPASPMLTITRQGNGGPVLLARTTATDADTVTWLPDAGYVFGPGSALSVSSTVANFTVQLHRRPAP